MTIFQAVVLGFVQALTEFLPISSSGHLVLIPWLLGWQDGGLPFAVATNTGTFLAILVYFRHELGRLWQGLWRTLVTRRPPDSPEGRLAWMLIFATAPAAVAGLLLHSWLEHSARTPLVIAVNTLVFALLLGWADRVGRQERASESLSFGEGLLIGCGQALALSPGTSRSGITMTVGLGLGLTRQEAARYSFLLAVPISALAGAKDLVDLVSGAIPRTAWAPMAVGLVVSAAAGYFVIAFFLAWLRTRPLTLFVVYRLALGAALLAIFLR